MATDIRQTHFRFGKDDGTEITHTWWQLEDTNHTQLISANWTFLLRFTEQEAGGTAAANTNAQFQYNKNGAGWVNITTSSAVVKAIAVAAFTDGQACTKRLSGTGTFETSGAGCTEDGLSGGTANDIAASGNSETEAGLQVVFADVAHGDTIQFRFTSPDWTVTYTITPTLTINTPQDRAGEVSWTEFEVPTAPRAAEVSWAEVETPTAPRAAEVSWAELETPVAPRHAEVSWSELEVPDVAGVKAEVSWAEFELPNAPRYVELSWSEFETPSAPRQAEVSWGELEVPTAPRYAELSWAEIEVPPAPPSYTTYGMPFLWTSANWGTVTIQLEVYIRAISGTVYTRLIDSNNNPVASSEVSTDQTSFQRLRSSNLTLTNALTYRVQLGKAGADSGEFLGAKLVIIPV